MWRVQNQGSHRIFLRHRIGGTRIGCLQAVPQATIPPIWPGSNGEHSFQPHLISSSSEQKVVLHASQQCTRHQNTIHWKHHEYRSPCYFLWSEVVFEAPRPQAVTVTPGRVSEGCV